MKDALFHLPNERLEGLESFALVFLFTYKHGFLFCLLWVKMQYQMEALNPIYMAPNMTVLTKMTKRQKFWIFILHCLMKGDSVDRMFPFAKWDICEWGSKYDPKNNWGSYKVCREFPCLSSTQK